VVYLSDNPYFKLSLAPKMISAKINNQAVILTRYQRSTDIDVSYERFMMHSSEICLWNDSWWFRIQKIDVFFATLYRNGRQSQSLPTAFKRWSYCMGQWDYWAGRSYNNINKTHWWPEHKSEYQWVCILSGVGRYGVIF